MSDEKRAPCPTCGSGDRKRLFSACTHYGTLDPWHFESDRPVLPVPAYVAYSGKIAGISDKVDLTENSSLAVAGRTQGERVGRQSVPPDTAEPSLGSPVPPASLCWGCNKPIADKAYGVGVRGSIHWECYAEIFSMAELRESASEAPSDEKWLEFCRTYPSGELVTKASTKKLCFMFAEFLRSASPEAPAAKEK